MEGKVYKFRFQCITPLLGSQPCKDVASEFIAAKHAQINGELPDDEAESLPEALERGTTVFHKHKGKPVLFDYHIKGFLKEAANTFNGMNGIRALRSKMDKYVFVYPRMIPLEFDGEIEYLERSLRAETAQGPRVALARSEMLPEDTSFDIEIEILGDVITLEMLLELLDYGRRKGLGQWRNGSYGRFEALLIQ